MGKVLKAKLYAGVLWILAVAFPGVAVVALGGCQTTEAGGVVIDNAAPVENPLATRPMTPCGAFDQLAQMLAQRHGEAPSQGALAGQHALGLMGAIPPAPGMVMLFDSDDSWTLVFVMPDGTACFLAEGNDWGPLGPGKGAQS